MTTSQQTSNPWFAISMGLVGLIAGYGIASGVSGIPMRAPAGDTQQQAGTTGGQPTPPPDQQAAPTPPPTTGTPASIDDDPMLGKKDAPITVIEFTDFQCPFCSRHYTQTFIQIKKDYIDTGKVRYVVRDFPLSFHPNAQKAAESAACANEQGKFWEMHDALFGKQAEWSGLPNAVDSFKKYAADLKFNTTQFNSCLDSDKFAKEIAKDEADGGASGIDGTPGFWILGPGDKTKKISGAYPYDTFKTTFEEMLK